VIAYASLGIKANVFIFALLAVPSCALWTSTRRRTPWISTLLLAPGGAVLGVWGVEWRLDIEYALAAGCFHVAAGAAIAVLHKRQGHLRFAHLTSVGSIVFVALGALVFDVSTAVFFAATIAVSLAFGLLASRASLAIAVVLGVAASLIMYRRFEILIALAVVFACALLLTRWMARLPVFVSIIVLAVLHPAITSENTHGWCAFTLLIGGEAFLLAQQKIRDQKIALGISAAAALIVVFSELMFFAGSGIGLTIAVAVIGLLITAKSRPIGLTILGLTVLKLFAIDWQHLNGPPRVAIFIAAAVTMLLFAVRVKTTPDEQRESSGRR
jgi:hypothetical protein